MEEINLPPFAPVLMESTRALGYSFEAAIADLLDNSISANATIINIYFWPFDNPYLAIMDNGRGMTSEELNIAMRYGSIDPLDIRADNDLGRFGLGLKTASLAQCRKLTVASKKENQVSVRRWDMDYVRERRDWALLCLNEEDYLSLPHIDDLSRQNTGTLVVWNEFDRLIASNVSLENAMNNKIAQVRDHLALIFHRYLTGEKGLKKITININNDAILPLDPFLTSLSTIYQDDEKLEINGSTIYVRSYMLPHISRLTYEEIKELGGKEGLTKNQGFYVYRNRRLLTWGTWFRLRRKDELSKLARIRVDIPNSLDDLWTLDIKKSTAIPPEIVKKNLARIVEKISEGSKKTWTFRGRRETSNTIVNTWIRFRSRNRIIYNLNRDHPMVDAVSSRLDTDGKNMLEQLLQSIEFNLPLNSLYVDLANDELFAIDEREETEKKVVEMAVVLMENTELSLDNKKELYDLLMITEPFSAYWEAVEPALKRCLDIEI